MANLPVSLPLQPIIFDDLNTTESKILETVLQTKKRVTEIAKASELNDVNLALRQGHNCVFIDIFSLEVVTGIQALESIRETFPYVPICLFSKSSLLSEMPGVNGYWKRRFHHYYKLQKDLPISSFETRVDGVLDQFDDYIEAALARRKISELVTLTEESNIDEEKKTEIAEIVEVVQKALQTKGESNLAKVTTIVPGVDTTKVEELVNTTLADAGRSLKVTTNVNIGVLLAGLLLVLSSFLVASITQRWEAVAFGGFGMAGVITSLVVNPLKSIGASARRLVQVQVAYLGFVSQLALLNEFSESNSPLERSERLGSEMARTLKTLQDHFGN